MNDTEIGMVLLKALNDWGIRYIYGVTGGGVLELLKHLPALHQQSPRFITLSEYVAGFAPIGNYLAKSEIAATACVSGAAIKLIGSGMSDAKVFGVPALYLVSLNHSEMENKTPLQDVGRYGMNIVAQLKAEFGEDAIHFSNVESFPECLAKIAQILSAKRPAIFMFHPDLLTKPTKILAIPPMTKQVFDAHDKLEECIDFIAQSISKQKCIYLYVCAEAGFNPTIKPILEQFCALVKPNVFCTVNGSNLCANLENFLGHVGLGGRYEVNSLWQALGANDVLITLGLEAGDYHFLNLKQNVEEAWVISQKFKGYGFIHESYAHRFSGRFNLLKADIAEGLMAINHRLTARRIVNLNPKPLLLNILESTPEQCAKNCVDIRAFYEALTHLWQENSIGFDDVCSAYRDRQYVMNQPSPNIRFYTSQDSSAMGGIIGLLVGAKVAQPSLNCFGFSGDGCWRLYGGALPELANLGINLFIFNNRGYGIVHHATQAIYDGCDSALFHTNLEAVDFVKVAKACGWDACQLKSDLSNLPEIIDRAYQKGRSFLIEVRTDLHQKLGPNPRELKLRYGK